MVYTGGIGQQSIAATRLVSDDVAAFKQYEMSLMVESVKLHEPAWKRPGDVWSISAAF